MTIEIYIKERAYGKSTTVSGRNISSSKSIYFKYNDFNELSVRLLELAGNSSILKMLSTHPNFKYEINIVNIN